MSHEMDVMKFPQVQAMYTELKKAASEMETCIRQINQAGGQLTNGGLLGKAGSSWGDGINGVLLKKMTEIRDTQQELFGDVKSAYEITKLKVAQAARGHRSG